MKQAITSVETLRKLLGTPHKLTQQKIYDHLFDDARQFIATAPLLMLATSGADGNVTVSPKGDSPAVAHVQDNNTLLIPERPGNKLLHGLSNILETGHVGLIFLRPGTDETLRVNGRCRIFQDDERAAEFSAHGKDALLILEITVEQCFFHCGKAFKRSKAWQPEDWPVRMKPSFGKQIAANAAGNPATRKAVELAVNAAVRSDYKNNL